MLRLLTVLGLAVACLVELGTAQLLQAPLDPTNNAPFQLSSAITNTEEFATFGHPKFPGHKVRVKKTNFCDPTVK